MTQDNSNDSIRPWDLSSTERVTGSKPVLQPRKTRRIPTKHVRFILALGLLLVIATMAIIGAVHWSISGQSDLQELVVLMSPITTLAGAVFAFYFTDSRKKKRRRK